MAKTYKQKIVFEGPKPTKAIYKKGKIIVYFKGKLIVSGGQILRGVFIETAKGDIEKTDAFLRKNKIFIPTTQRATKVLYGWSPFTDGNLVNTNGLPCSTFSMTVQAAFSP